jgi:hypothetical protein
MKFFKKQLVRPGTVPIFLKWAGISARLIEIKLYQAN